MLFITTDPARDTGPVLRKLPRPVRPDFHGLTGTLHVDQGPSRRRWACRSKGSQTAARRRVRGRSRCTGDRLRSRDDGAGGLDGGDPGRRHGARHRPCSTSSPDRRTSLPAVLTAGLASGTVASTASWSWPRSRAPPGGMAPRPAARSARYALCIIARGRRRGLGRGPALGGPRWHARAPSRDVAVWAVPFGLVGGRLYHVVTDSGAVLRRRQEARSTPCTSGRAVSVSGARSRSVRSAPTSAAGERASRFLRCADALAPGIAIAQAIGRWGNWFNQELYGRPTDLPWGARDRPRAPRRGLRAVHHLPSDVPLRVALVPRRRRAGDLGRPALHARLRPGLRAVRDGVQRGPRLDRVPARRHGQPLLGRAAQRLDLDRPVPAGRWPTSWSSEYRPGQEASARRPDADHRRSGDSGRRGVPRRPTARGRAAAAGRRRTGEEDNVRPA